MIAATLLLAAKFALTTAAAKRAQTVRADVGPLPLQDRIRRQVLVRLHLQAPTQLLVLVLPPQPHVQHQNRPQRRRQARLKAAARVWRVVVDLAVIQPAVALPRDA